MTLTEATDGVSRITDPLRGAGVRLTGSVGIQRTVTLRSSHVMRPFPLPTRVYSVFAKGGDRQ